MRDMHEGASDCCADGSKMPSKTPGTPAREAAMPLHDDKMPRNVPTAARSETPIMPSGEKMPRSM